MTGVLLQTVDLAVSMAVEMDWKLQVVFALLWAAAVTLLAYLAMMCIPRIAAVEAENVDTFQVNFFVGVFSALASTILLQQVLLGNQRMLWCTLPLLVLLRVDPCVSVRVCRNMQDRDEQPAVVSTESFMPV